MMHDYAHCLDYTEDCPKACFRGELVRDYRERQLAQPVSWMHFKGTDECKMYCRKPTNADGIRAMTDEELAELFARFETRCYERLEPLVKCETETFARQHLDWLKQEVDE